MRRPAAPSSHRRRRNLRRRALLAIAGAAAATLVTASYIVWWAPVPALEDVAPRPPLTVLAADGQVLYRDRSDGLRIEVALEDVAPVFLDAVVATEDQRFWSHPGVDPLAVTRAVLRSPWEYSGASTITMQVARGRYHASDRSSMVLGKARQALRALQLDARYSKAALLEAYVNDAYFGRQAYGVEAAARVYFGIPAAHLDRAQATFLAGLIQSPALAMSGDTPGPAALARQEVVLRRMVEEGRITREQASAVRARPLDFAEGADIEEIAPRFVEYVLEQLPALPNVDEQRSLVVETTLDAGLQRATMRSARAQLEALAPHEASATATVALRPSDGAILAMASVASAESPGAQLNMALQPRQPGSALKPFVYAAALEEGYTAGSPLLDVPSEFESVLGLYTPANYDLRFRGPVTLRTALASSLNVPAVRTLEALGIDSVLALAGRVGLAHSLGAPEAYGLSLGLGGAEVTPLDLTSAYGVLAAAGQRAEPYAIARVRDAATGRVLYERSDAGTVQALDPGVAFILSDILADPEARVPGFGDAAVLRTPARAAVKTGTSSGFTDNWALGYAGDVAVGVWVGNADERPMLNVSGITGAAPLWREVLTAALEETAPLPASTPAGVEAVTLCAPTGLLAGADCPSARREWVPTGSAPTSIEEYYLPTEGGSLALALPADARAWAAAAGVRLASGDEGPPTSLLPAQGSILHLTPEFGGSRTLLRAALSPSARRAEFRIDGRLVGVAASPAPGVAWDLEAGRHVLEVTAVFEDERSYSASAIFEVQP